MEQRPSWKACGSEIPHTLGNPKFHYGAHNSLPLCTTLNQIKGHMVAQVVEALRYKPEHHGFDSRWRHWIFHWHNPSGRTMTPGYTQASKRNEYQEYFKFTTFMCRLSWNLGASTSWNPQGLSRPVMGLLYLYLYLNQINLVYAIPNCSFKSHFNIILPYMPRSSWWCPSFKLSDWNMQIWITPFCTLKTV